MNDEERIKDLKAIYSGAIQSGEIGIANMIKGGIDLIEKLQKENEILKQEKELAWEEWNILEQGSYETELKLKEENEELKEDLKYVLNQTLKAFEKNWCIDWNFTEIREKYNLESE